MKISHAGCLVLGMVVCTANAQITTEYRSRREGFQYIWEEGTNWEKKIGGVWTAVQSSDDYPKDCSDSVWIRDGFTITLLCAEGNCDGQVVCGKLQIDNGGLVWLEGGTKLTLCDTDTSRIDGIMTTSCNEVLSSCSPSEIAVDGTVTIQGGGGYIVTEDVGGNGAAALVITGEEGSLTIDGDTPGDTATSMSIIARHNQVEIQAGLSNLGDVVAESLGYSPSLSLTTDAKGGSGGYYRATHAPGETDGGSLEVHVPMSGSCDFQVLAPAAHILIDYALTCYAGDFLLEKGTLELNERVCTSGKFTGGHHGASDDAYLIVRKAANGPPHNKLLYDQDCGCQ